MSSTIYRLPSLNYSKLNPRTQQYQSPKNLYLQQRTPRGDHLVFVAQNKDTSLRCKEIDIIMLQPK
jgi:hypothetical protein